MSYSTSNESAIDSTIEEYKKFKEEYNSTQDNDNECEDNDNKKPTYQPIKGGHYGAFAEAQDYYTDPYYIGY